MKLIDLANIAGNKEIMIRANSPIQTEKDMLLGYAEFKDGKIISLDGDTYPDDMQIEKYEIRTDYLVVWTINEWL